MISTPGDGLETPSASIPQPSEGQPEVKARPSDGTTNVDAPASHGNRILIIDDAPAIHEDIRQVLCGPPEATAALDAMESELFGTTDSEGTGPVYEIDSAYQGREGLDLIVAARRAGRPYAMAFVDMRMPPGWDGLETVSHIWTEDPFIQIVICSAYSDYSWAEITETVGHTHRLLILKKPFDVIEVQQLSKTLVTKWSQEREIQGRLADLEGLVRVRTADLERVNVSLQQEITDRERAELELRHAQKLEAVGRLAAGVAHEINTPIQYVGDSIHFLETSFRDLLELVSAYRTTFTELVATPLRDTLQQKLSEAEDTADLPYLEENVPGAFERTLEGTDRVASIVRALKEFAHPGQHEKSSTDLNRALESALTVARNEYKYVAEVETELTDIPPAMCHAGDLNQVILNLLVNAAHAIGDANGDSGTMGTIRVRTADEGETVLIAIEDSGGGIPEDIRDQVFDPFFTTKEVGRGTGQGLAIARSIVVDKHGGSLTFESEIGRGTTFFLRLPTERALRDVEQTEGR